MVTREYDVRDLAAPKHRLNRTGSYIFIGVGVLFAVLAAELIYNILFVPPHTLTVCAKGGCTQVTPSTYYPELEVFAIAFGALALFVFVSSWWSWRGPSPGKLAVNNAGLRVTYTNNKVAEFPWENARLKFTIYDSRNRKGGPSRRPEPSPFRLVIYSWTLWTPFTLLLPPECIPHLLECARNAGSRIDEHPRIPLAEGVTALRIEYLGRQQKPG